MTDDDRIPVSADLARLNPELAAYLCAADDITNRIQAPVTVKAEPPAQGDGQGQGKAVARPKRSRGAKFHNEPTIYNGRRYDSKKEAAHAEWLDLLKEQGIILSWVPQVPFPLPGGATHKVDFLVWYPPIEPGGMPFAGLQEVKGRDLALGKLKRRQVEEIYRLKVEII